jgi:hypothetical protein
MADSQPVVRVSIAAKVLITAAHNLPDKAVLIIALMERHWELTTSDHTFEEAR